MGNALQRAARAQFIQTRHPVDPSLESRAVALRERDAAREATLRAGRGDHLDSELNTPLPATDQVAKLIRAIEPHKLEMYTEKDIEKLARRRTGKEDREDANIGRITTISIRAALEQGLREKSQGAPQAKINDLARQYGANEVVLSRLLDYAALPPVERSNDGRLIAKGYASVKR